MQTFRLAKRRRLLSTNPSKVIENLWALAGHARLFIRRLMTVSIHDSDSEPFKHWKA
jgi:hypothetical protein